MFQPSEVHLAAIFDWAAKCAPQEACGVIANNRFLPISNKATDFDSFIFDAREYIAISRDHEIEAIVHSHVGWTPHPSDADRAMCEKLALPWLIVSVPSGAWAVVEPSGWQAPLVGRSWVWGCQDCLAVVRDGLKQLAGIEVPDFERGWEFWKGGADLIAEQYAGTGFRALPAGTPPRHCDVFGIQMPSSPVINHLALFLDPDLILHQLVGRPSRREFYDGRWQGLTRLHLRHGGAP